MKTIMVLLSLFFLSGCGRHQNADYKAEYDISQVKEPVLDAAKARIPLNVFQNGTMSLVWAEAGGQRLIDDTTKSQIYSLLKTASYRRVKNTEKRLCIGSLCSKNPKDKISFDFYFGGLFSCNEEWFYIGSECVNQIVATLKGVKE